jgi:hypothetical protein
LSSPTYSTFPLCTSIDWYNPSSPFFEVKIFPFENNLAVETVMINDRYEREVQGEHSYIYIKILIAPGAACKEGCYTMKLKDYSAPLARVSTSSA